MSFVTYSLLWAEEKNLQLTSIETYCDDALEWYDDHPGYNGEFTRVLEYCKTYSKNVSPSGFSTNPILSDFGAMNGVNTRPRDQMHQGIDIIGPQNQPIIAIADGKVLETTIEDCWGATVVIDHGKSINGENLITRDANGVTKLGANSLNFQTKNDTGNLWGTDANGNTIPLNVTNGSKMLIATGT